MKKVKLILGLALLSMCASGCDAIDNIFGPTKPEDEQKDEDKDVLPKSIEFTEPEVTLDIGDTYQIQSTVLPEGANQEVKYEDYDYHIMDVSSTGKITASGDEDGKGGHTRVKVVSEVDEAVFAHFDVYINDREEDIPLAQTITASATSAYSDEAVTLTTNAPTSTWSITSGSSYADLSATTGNSVNLVGKAAGSVTVKAVANGYEDATTTITFNQRPVGVYYTVTFNSNGGSISPSSKSVAENGTFTFPSPGTKTHYTFLGWSSIGDSTKYQTGATSPAVTENITYTAYWQEDAKYTVTYVAGSNGTGSYSHENQYVGSYTLLTFGSLTGVSASSGYIFSNYTVGGVNKNSGQTISISGATTVTVNFEKEPDPGDYYSVISSTDKGETLKTKLHNLIKITSPGWSYGELYDCYRHSDVMPDGQHFYDIYSDTTMFTLYDSRINQSYSKEGDGMNREHMIPQSYFNEASPMKSDAHHVLPSDGYVNNRRGSYPHGIVTGSPTYTSNNGCKLGKGTGSTTVFEPMEKYKGDTARIYFYFVTCYQNKLSSFGSFGAFTNNTFPSINTTFLEVYLRWCQEDPVSEKETTRNNVIYEGYSGHNGQGNRNPFIDHPEYACKIWGNTNDTTRSICGEGNY